MYTIIRVYGHESGQIDCGYGSDKFRSATSEQPGKRSRNPARLLTQSGRRGFPVKTTGQRRDAQAKFDCIHVEF